LRFEPDFGDEFAGIAVLRKIVTKMVAGNLEAIGALAQQ
jgi:hypothetical protein